MLIHVCYSLYDVSGKYSKFLGMSIQSLLDNTDETVTIHVLHDSTLTDENKNKLSQIVYTQGNYIVFYDVEMLMSKERKRISKNMSSVNDKFSVACFYRTLIPDVLSQNISKAIYLDADTIINLDIKELWDRRLGLFPIAAIPQATSGHTKESMSKVNPLVRKGIFDWDNYFNSGVLMMNLSQIRGGGGLSI